MTLFTAVAGSMSQAHVDQFHAEVLHRADFAPREEFFTALTASFWEVLRRCSYRFVTLRWYGALLLAACLLAPVLVSLLAFGRRIYLERLPVTSSPWRRFLPWAAVLAILAPEFMNLLGVDSMRWHVYCVLAAYLCLAALSMRLPQGPIRFSDADLRWIILVVALNLCGGFGLYEMQIRPYPFFPSLFHYN